MCPNENTNRLITPEKTAALSQDLEINKQIPYITRVKISENRIGFRKKLD
jgi:hypothetical protein